MAIRSSGNLTADRRFDYAVAAKRDGDFLAAADLLEQALELAPLWTAGWFTLGETALLANDHSKARNALMKALSLDPSDELGASLKLAQLDGKTIAMPKAYVAGLFDDYAPRFDKALRDNLHYNGPEILLAAVKKVAPLRLFHHALDLGCGTGLVAEVFSPIVKAFSGADLSANMVAIAQRRGLYQALAVADLADWLQTQHQADLAIAADVFVYIKELTPLFDLTLNALQSNGLLAFTIQSHSGQGTILGEDMRYCHSPDEVKAQLQSAGFMLLLDQSASTRLDRGKPVPGHIYVVQKP